MKKILIITTGGTIASRPTGSGLAPGDIRSVLYDKLVVFAGSFQIDIKSVFSKDSSNMIPGDWDTVAVFVREHLNAYDGFVILHGTDTMSYSAAMLAYLLIGIEKTVIVTGSQIPLVEKNSDGAANLTDAVIAAADSRLKGVFLVFHEKVISGTRAYKRSSVNKDAYLSCNYPYAGVIKDQLLFLTEEYQREKEKEHLGSLKSMGLLGRLLSDKQQSCLQEPPKIFLMKMFPGIDADVLAYLAVHGYHGIIMEGFGLGGIPVENTALMEQLKRLIDRHIPVIMSTQCVYDGVNLSTYEVGIAAERIGIISAFDMTSEAAYTKLFWILSMTRDDGLIRQAMQTNFCGEILC